MQCLKMKTKIIFNLIMLKEEALKEEDPKGEVLKEEVQTKFLGKDLWQTMTRIPPLLIMKMKNMIPKLVILK